MSHKLQPRSFLVRAIWSFLPILMLAPAAFAQQTTEYIVSIPKLRVSTDDSVVSFEVDVTAGAFESASNLPVGWYIAIDNDASWQTKITANTTVGAAALKPEEFEKLRFSIDKNESGGLKFRLSGIVSVTKDFQKSRPIPLKMGDFAVVPKP
ncbi:MAG TPA: hypothetical protein VMA09_02830 [Candidatus Binataceae bacterium]|nr:hypothetical protein [Candidatus Binataceae bacterium]